jgi:hypothetical protein
MDRDIYAKLVAKLRTIAGLNDKFTALETPASVTTTGVTNSRAKYNSESKMVAGHLIFANTTYQAGWNNSAGTISPAPSDYVSGPVWNGENGKYFGMYSIDTEGVINLFNAGNEGTATPELSVSYFS